MIYLIRGSGGSLLRLVFGSPKILMRYVTELPSWLRPGTGFLWQHWQPFLDCSGGPGRCGSRCSTVLRSHKPQQLLCIYKRYLFRTNFLNTVTCGEKMSINVWDTFLLTVVAYFSWTSSFFIRKNTRKHFTKICSFQRFDKLTVKYQFYRFLIWTIYIQLFTFYCFC